MIAFLLRAAASAAIGIGVQKLWDSVSRRRGSVKRVLHLEGGRIARTEGAGFESLLPALDAILTADGVREGRISLIEKDGKRRVQFRGDIPEPTQQRIRNVLLA